MSEVERLQAQVDFQASTIRALIANVEEKERIIAQQNRELRVLRSPMLDPCPELTKKLRGDASLTVH